MKDKKHIEPFVDNVEKILNSGSYLNQLDDEVSKKLENYEEDKINLKEDLLNNLNIANVMFNKYSSTIFDDIELREESQKLFKKLRSYFL